MAGERAVEEERVGVNAREEEAVVAGRLFDKGAHEPDFDVDEQDREAHKHRFDIGKATLEAEVEALVDTDEEDGSEMNGRIHTKCRNPYEQR